MGLTQLNLEGVMKVDVALDRIRNAGELAREEGLYVAFSCGKDSVAIHDLVKRSGVPLLFAFRVISPMSVLHCWLSKLAGVVICGNDYFGNTPSGSSSTTHCPMVCTGSYGSCAKSICSVTLLNNSVGWVG